MTEHRKKTELQRLLSKKGIASRTKAAELIKQGKVRVNGRIVRDPLSYTWIEASVTVDGENPPAPQEKLLVAFNKPKGVVTTTSDEKGRRTVFDVLPKKYHHLKAVGRLDMATTGLLLFTNDPYLADRLLDPKNKVPRTYVVTIKGHPTPETIESLEKGVLEKGEMLKARKIEVRKTSGKESIVLVTLEEGKNREIRRMFRVIKHEVIALKRISFGDIELGDLESGATRVVPFPKI